MDEEQARAIFVAKKLEGAELDEAVANAILSKSQKDTVKSTGTLSDAMKGLGVAIKTNPLFWAAGGALAIWGIIKAIDYFTVSIDEARDAASESLDSFTSLQSEIESVKSELEASTDRMKELEQQPNLTFVEQSELDKLKETNDELERQLRTKQTLVDIAGKEARESAIAYLDKSDSYARYLGFDMSNVEAGNQRYGQIDEEMFSGNVLEIAEQKLADYEALVSRKKDLENEMDTFIQTNPENYGQSDIYRNMQMEMNAISNNMDILQNDLSVSVQEFQQFDDALDIENDSAYINSINQIVDSFNRLFGSGIGQSLTDKFDAIWNADSFKQSRKEIEALASAGKITGDVLSSNEKYKQLIEETGATADEVASHINSLMEAEDKNGSFYNTPALSYSGTIEELNKMSAALSAMDEAYSHFIDKDAEITFGDLSSISEQFKDVSGIEDYVKAIQDAKGNAKATQKAFNDLAGAYVEHTGILDQVNEGNARLIQSYLEEQGIANADILVQQALTDSLERVAAQKYYTATASAALDGATANEVNRIFDEADAAGISRIALFDLERAKISCNNTGVVTDGDIENLIALANAAGIAEAAVKNAKAAQGQKASSGVARSAGAENAINQSIYDNLNAGIDAELYKPKEYTFSGGAASNKSRGGGGGNGGGGSSAKDTTQEIDWLERKLDLLKKKRDDLSEKASSDSLAYLGLDSKAIEQAKALFDKMTSMGGLSGDDFKQFATLAGQAGVSITDFYAAIQNGGTESRASALSALLETNKVLLEEYTNAAEIYRQKYEDSLSGLSDDIRSKIESGDVTIETYSGDEADRIQKAIDARDKYLSTLDEEEQTREDVHETSKKIYENEIDYLGELNDRVEAQNTLINAQISYLEAAGQVVNASSYEALIANLQRQQSIIEKQLQKRREELKALMALDPDFQNTPEYYELLGYIEECESSLVDLDTEIQNVNNDIMKMPIERMQTAIDMYNDMTDAMTNWAAEIEASGKQVDAEYYQALIENGATIIDQYKEQADLIRDVMGEYEVGSKNWQELYDQLQDINSQMSSMVQNLHKWNEELLKMPINSISSQIDQLNQVLNGLEKLQGDYDTVISAVVDAVQKQKDALADENEATNEEYASKIEALQSRLDLIKKQNAQVKLQLAYEKALYDLQNANTQKTERVKDCPNIW